LGADPHGHSSPALERFFPSARKGSSVEIVSWIVIGALVGVLVNWLSTGEFPGGLVGTTIGGMAGGFVGGGLFSWIVDRRVEGFDLVSLLIALLGATVLLAALQRAGYAGP
jgi:uncharacterized membrane protein YeaQ/YmgE (transglycosylase-associated protein family)